MAGAVDVPESQILPWWGSPAQEAPVAEVPLRLFNFSSEHSRDKGAPQSLFPPGRKEGKASQGREEVGEGRGGG